MEGVRIEHRVVGSQHLITSPDLPGLFVAHTDREKAERDIPAAIKMLKRMQARREEKK